jgi:hypothetical protein
MAARNGRRHPSVPGPRFRRIERVLVPASDVPLSLDALEQACRLPLARLLRRAVTWGDHGGAGGWKLGDYNILIVETSVARDVALYVQFWSEPGQPLLCEVSSGEWDPAAKKFIPRDAAARLAKLGFRKGGQAGNYRREAVTNNRGGVEALAREVLRIFHGILRYRGRTPLVATLMHDERAGRAVVHTGVTPDDLAMLLRMTGFDTKVPEVPEGRLPVVLGREGEFLFYVQLASPSKAYCGFECLDFATTVGRLSAGTADAWRAAVNTLNGQSRVARAWFEEDGRVVVGTSFILSPGMTLDALVGGIGAWQHAAQELAKPFVVPPKRGGRKGKKAVPVATAGEDGAESAPTDRVAGEGAAEDGAANGDGSPGDGEGDEVESRAPVTVH